MFILGFIYHWGGGVVMIAAFLIGVPDSFTATQDFVSWASPWGIQPLHFAFWLLVIGAIYTTIVQGIRAKRLESALPNITVEPKVYENHAILEVRNTGGEADFTAMARVIATIPESNLYTMYWQPTGDSKRHIDGNGGIAPILVAEKAEEDYSLTSQDIYKVIFKGSLALYRIGNAGIERFPVFSRERSKKINGDTIRESGVPIARCIVEIALTATPRLRRKWGANKYIIEVDKTDGKLKFHETTLSTPHKEVPWPE